MMLKLVDIVISYHIHRSRFKEWYIILYQFQLVPNTFALSKNCLNKLVRFIPCHNELMFSPIFFAPWTFIHFIHNRGAKQFNLTGLCLLRDAPIKEVSECYWVFKMKHKLNQIVFLLFNKLNCISIFNKSNFTNLKILRHTYKLLLNQTY